jgi:hypothetical protein
MIELDREQELRRLDDAATKITEVIATPVPPPEELKALVPRR